MINIELFSVTVDSNFEEDLHFNTDFTVSDVYSAASSGIPCFLRVYCPNYMELSPDQEPGKEYTIAPLIACTQNVCYFGTRQLGFFYRMASSEDGVIYMTYDIIVDGE